MIGIGNNILMKSLGYSEPTYISHTTTNATAVMGITATKPANIGVGDLLLIIIHNDSTSISAQWDSSTNKPTGFTFLEHSGNDVSDTHSGLFYRIADGTEGATVFIPTFSTAAIVVFYIHIKGASATAPINSTFSGQTAVDATSVIATKPTSGSTGDLSIVGWGFDGGDGGAFTISGTGWSIIDSQRNSTSSVACSGGIGQRRDDSAVGTSPTITATVSDGWSYVHVRIKK